MKALNHEVFLALKEMGFGDFTHSNNNVSFQNGTPSEADIKKAHDTVLLKKLCAEKDYYLKDLPIHDKPSSPELASGIWAHYYNIINQIDALYQDASSDLKETTASTHLAYYRYRVETSGINVAGNEITTDRSTQATLNGAYSKAKDNPEYTTPWKAENGFTTLDAATVLLISNAVHDHVRLCFAAEFSALQSLNFGNITSLTEVEDAFNAALTALQA